MRLVVAARPRRSRSPAPACAAGARARSEIPSRRLAAPRRSRPARFDLVGLHWQGPGNVAVPHAQPRRALERLARVAPRRGPRRTAARRGGSASRLAARQPVLGRHALQVPRRRSRHAGCALYVVEPAEDRDAARTSLDRAASPPIITRAGWNADESIRRAPPRYANGVHFAVVHHTAGSNAYTTAQSAAIVRGIELYHVQGKRLERHRLQLPRRQVRPGVRGPVRRDRAKRDRRAREGFNTGSVGVAVIGNYSATAITPAARARARHAARVAARRRARRPALERRHVDVRRQPEATRRGAPVTLRAISGHRDTGFTSCPGASAVRPAARARARRSRRPGCRSSTRPSSSGAARRPVRFTARLSAARRRGR